MAIKAVSFTASDILGLASNFIPHNTRKNTTQQHVNMHKANGDIQKKSSPFNQVDNIIVPYRWSEDTGLGIALTSAGSVQNSYIVTGIRIETNDGDYPMINFAAHAHDVNSEATDDGLAVYDIPADMIAILTGAFGAYDFAGKEAANVQCRRSVYEITIDHRDRGGNDGNHWTAYNRSCEERIECEYTDDIATPTTLAGWTVEGADDNDDNDDWDNSRIVAVRAVARN